MNKNEKKLIRLIKCCWKDLLCGLIVSFSLFVFDNSIAMFLLFLTISIVTSISMGFYRLKKIDSSKDNMIDCSVAIRFGLILSKVDDIDDAIKEFGKECQSSSLIYQTIINKEFDSLISYKGIGEITKDMIECHNNKNNDGIRLNITKLIDIENQKEQTFKTTEDMRSTGLIMSLCISIPLMFFPVITLINETLSNVEWLGLVLELISIIFFEIVELYGNNLNEKKRRLVK